MLAKDGLLPEINSYRNFPPGKTTRVMPLPQTFSTFEQLVNHINTIVTNGDAEITDQTQ
jgi:hypothetical protein